MTKQENYKNNCLERTRRKERVKLGSKEKQGKGKEWRERSKVGSKEARKVKEKSVK